MGRLGQPKATVAGVFTVLAAMIVFLPTTAFGAIPTPVNGQITSSQSQSNVKVLGDAPAAPMGNLYERFSGSPGIPAFENSFAPGTTSAIDCHEIYSTPSSLADCLMVDDDQG